MYIRQLGIPPFKAAFSAFETAQKHGVLGAFPKPLSTDAERLTAESAKSHFEFLEVRQSAPFRRNSTSKRVRSALATRQIENLKRSWKHIWQRTCANTTPTSVAKTKQRTKRVYSSMHDGCNKRTCQLVVRHVEAAKSQSDCRFTIARPELAMRRWRCGNKGRLGVFLLAISEVGCTYLKKVPLGVRLLSTR